MEQPSPIVDLANLLFFLIFTIALLLSAVRIWFRIARYKMLMMRIPVLLWRDAALTTGLALPFGAILLVRAVGLISIRTELWWVILTGLPASVAMIVFTIFEYFIIDDKERIIVAPTAHQIEDRDFGDKRRALEQQHLNERATSENDPDPPGSPWT